MIVGPSGSGKTTLLNLIGCIDAPTRGHGSKCAARTSGRCRTTRSPDFRARNIGFIFQGFSLVPVLSAYENVEYPLLLVGMAAAERRRRTLAMLEAVGLAAQAQPAAERIVRRPEAARGDRARAGEAADSWCWPTSRPPISTAPPVPRSSR